MATHEETIAMDMGTAPVALTETGVPKTARQRSRRLAVLALVLLLLGAGGIGLVHFLQDDAAPVAIRKKAGPAAGTRERTGSASEAGTKAAPAGDGAKATPGITRPAGTEGTAAPLAGTAQEILLAPITEFRPDTVYAGNLGELTRLQAGAEIARANLALKEVEVRLHELENRTAQAAPSGRGQAADGKAAAPTMAAMEAAIAREVQAGLDKVLGELKRARTAGPAAMGLAVRAVRGPGNRLEAELVSRYGVHFVREGELLPGLGRVTEVSRHAVRVDNAALPWR